MSVLNRLYYVFRTHVLRTLDQFSMRYRNVSIGKGTWVGRGTVIRGNVKIGRDCYIGPYCIITRFSRIGNHVFIAPFFLSTNDNRMAYHRRGHGTNLRGVTIGDHVRIAGHVMTLPGVRIGEGAIVGAYSLVTKDVEPYTLVYGIPAKKHKDRHGFLEEKILPRFR